MAEEKIHNVDVRLRYTVTGSKEAAEKALTEELRFGKYRLERLCGEDFEARNQIVDVNPDKCESYRNYETFSIQI